MMFPAIFLDRDGVIIENQADYVRDWSHVHIFPEAIHALSNMNLKDHKIIIVTNQSAVGQGLISLETANAINSRLIEVIHNQHGRIDGAYLCPHLPDDKCGCRKPKPGMLLQAEQELSLDLKRSWMVGDAWSDIQAGHSAGVRGTIIVKTGRGADQLLLPRPEGIGNPLVCDNLTQAFEAILAHNTRE